jgi:hypothetical protein
MGQVIMIGLDLAKRVFHREDRGSTQSTAVIEPRASHGGTVLA